MIEEFDLFVEDLLGEKMARPLIIVGASKIDELLKSILLKYLIEKPSKDEDLLEGDRPLSTFSSRMKLSYRLGLIDKDFLFLLEQLRALRNKSAHGVGFNIEKPPLKDFLQNIKKGLSTRESYRLTKERFFKNIPESKVSEIQCLLITMCVILQSIFEKVNRTSGSIEAIKISKK